MKMKFINFMTKLKRKEVIKDFQRFARRAEYFLLIMTVTYLFAIFLQGMYSDDFTAFSDVFANIMGIFLMVKEDWQIFLTIAIITGAFISLLYSPVKTLLAIMTILSLFLIANKNNLLGFLVVLQDSLKNIFNYFLNYPSFGIFVGLCLFVLLLRYPIIRRKVFHGFRTLIEFSALVLAIYYSTFYINVFYLFVDYVNLFTDKFIYVEKFFEITGIVFLIIVFSLFYSSIFKALCFHVKHKKEKIHTQIKDNDLPVIGVCIPAFNEELTILETLSSVLSSNYPENKLHIIVVSDGSTDGTIEKVRSVFQMEENMGCLKSQYSKIKHKNIRTMYESVYFPNLFLIDKENGGKFDCLNTALDYFDGEVHYMTVIDADTLLDKNALKILARNSKDAVASTGLILPVPNKNSFFAKIFTNWQTFDYLASFHISRASLSLKNNMMIVSGAFGLFQRFALVNVGGYKNTLGEDIYLTLELQQMKDSQIIYVPEAIAYTQVPDSLESIRKQRIRWFKGLTESLFRFKGILKTNPKMRSPYIEFFILEWLTPLIAPFGLVLILGKSEILKTKFTLILLLITIFSNLLESVIAFFIERSYRKNLSFNLLSFLWVQIIMAPLMILYRNDAILEYYKKDWDKVKRY